MSAPAPAAVASGTLLRSLLLRLLGPLLMIVAATGAIGAYTARYVTERTFDRWLLDGAHSLADQVRVGPDGQAQLLLGDDALAILAFDAVDTTYFSVRQGARHIAGQPGLPGPPVRGSRPADAGAGAGEAVVYEASFAGHPVRVAAVQTRDGQPPVVVQVAETLRKRSLVRQDLAMMLVPLAALLVSTVLAVVLASRWTLRPLEPIAARWRAQSSSSLEPLRLDDVPRELQPFARALNELLGRIQAVLQRERRFAADAAHQIRTPLAGLQLGLSRAAEAADLAQARHAIGELQQVTQRTARLLQQLLALGRLDPENAHDLRQAPVDLGRLAQEVGEADLDTALARRIDFELLLPEGPVWVAGQPDLLSEALGNLVDNALRYTPAGGRVQLAVRADPPTLCVSDSGPGVPAEERPAVLERFVRGRAARGEGSGLGLAIARDIAALHGAQLHLEDSALGGLAVRLVFEASPPRPGPAPAGLRA